MTTNSEQTYKMTLSLNVLNHLGIGLYSNVPAVLSEVIANAWDADAERVEIKIDSQNGQIIIQDDGHGMSVADANDKYLTIGYARREDGGAKTPNGRPVMGRKGIGKLSLFSIANTIEVHSVKDGEKHGFKMNIEAIKLSAVALDGIYSPEPIPTQQIELDKGTRIILTDMKRRLNQTGTALRRRLARRFSVMGEKHNFIIVLDEELVTIEDRGYHDKLQYIWTFGEKGKEVASIAKNIEHSQGLPPKINMREENYEAEIDGWIGTVRWPKDLKEQDTKESINGIVIMVRGKLAQENILEEFGDENLYSEYIIGEVHADFLDQDDKEDIATTSRQKLIEEDPRYQAVKQALAGHLRTIQNEWRKQRDNSGKQIATAIPQINEWYENLNPDHKKNAERLFSHINRLPIKEEADKRRIFIGSILAFESLRFRNSLNRLDEISSENLGALANIFENLDDLEQSAYYQIIKDRIQVIRKLTSLVDADAKERALQEHLYTHLWLLDPSWERAARTEHMETRIYNALNAVYESLSDEQKLSRIDIHYTTTGNKHVIIELKRSGKVLSTTEIYDQIQKYRHAAWQVLTSMSRGNEPLEFICVLGSRPREWGDAPDAEQVFRASIAPFNARIVMYDELIQNALEAYQDYVDRSKEAGRVYQLIRSINEEDANTLHPDDD